MARPRKIHVQAELSFTTRPGDRRARGLRRVRKGVRLGRPPKGARSSERHKTRPDHDARHPVHVTLRVERALGTLRARDKYKACRKALGRVLGRDDFRIVHISLQDGHLHLLVEAADKGALAKGIQAFEISAARYLNQACSQRRGRIRRGRVFSDRYHARAIASPRGVRHALAYVLNNWRRHGRDQGMESMFWAIDPFSSATSFAGWSGDELPRDESLETDGPLPVSRSETWLLTVGWKRHGLISPTEVPGAAARRMVA